MSKALGSSSNLVIEECFMDIECDENFFINVNNEGQPLLAPVIGYDFHEY